MEITCHGPNTVVAAGMPAVITYTVPPNAVLCDGIPIVEACRRLEEDGADVVGLNCGRGPATMIPLLKEIKKVCKVMLLIPFSDFCKEIQIKGNLKFQLIVFL